MPQTSLELNNREVIGTDNEHRLEILSQETFCLRMEDSCKQNVKTRSPVIHPSSVVNLFFVIRGSCQKL